METQVIEKPSPNETKTNRASPELYPQRQPQMRKAQPSEQTAPTERESVSKTKLIPITIS